MPHYHLKPGRELVRCARHSHAWYPRAHGCSICRAQRRAEQLADQLTADLIRAHLDRANRERLLAQQFDNEPAARPRGADRAAVVISDAAVAGSLSSGVAP